MDAVYFQLTPIPEGLHPPNEMETLAYAASDKEPPLKVFLDGEKEAFEEWADSRPLGGFNIIQGYPTQFACFSTEVPEKGEDSPIERKFANLMDDICTGAVYGDTGTELAGVSFSSRARWVVTKDGLNVKANDKLSIKPKILILLLLILLGFAIGSLLR